METYDVVIVGAGPAGISTALHLERLAPHLVERTLILEKARHPRRKLCGGGITADGLIIMRNLGLDFAEVPSIKVEKSHFRFQNIEVTFQISDFHVVLREDFDAWLASAARQRGFAIREDEPVRRIALNGQGVEVFTTHREYRARIVIGADGAHSRVRRAIGGNRHRRYARALLVWVPPRPDSSHVPNEAYCDFTCLTQNIPGYIWDFPFLLHGQPMRCWGIGDFGIGVHEPRRMQQILAEELAHHGYRLEDYHLYGDSLPAFSPKNLFSAPHVLLVGDALGVEVFYGEGIAPALAHGRFAAEAILDALDRNDFTFPSYRARILRSELGRMLRRRMFLANTFYRLRHPFIQRWLWGQMSGIFQWTMNRLVLGWAQKANW